MKDNIPNEHYYKLRMAYQERFYRLSMDDIQKFIELAQKMLFDANFTTNFEKERLEDFIDELEVHIENFDTINKKNLKPKKKKQKNKFNKHSKYSRDFIIEQIKDTYLKNGVFKDSNGDVVIILKKDDAKEIKRIMEKNTIIAAILLCKTFKDAAKMIGVTERTFRVSRKRHCI